MSSCLMKEKKSELTSKGTGLINSYPQFADFHQQSIVPGMLESRITMETSVDLFVVPYGLW